MKAKIAFYKGGGTIFDRLIRLYTFSKYSHCEIVINDKWYSSSARDGGVRMKVIPAPNLDNWEFINIDIDEYILNTTYADHKNKGYDWLGIFLTQFINLNINSKNKMYCSEFCAEVLQFDTNVSPEDLYQILICYNK